MRRCCDCSFDRGFGPGVVRSRNSVVQGHWNRVRVYCNSWNGYVQLNDGPTAKGKPKVRYQACVCMRARACVCEHSKIWWERVIHAVWVVMHHSNRFLFRILRFFAFSEFEVVWASWWTLAYWNKRICRKRGMKESIYILNFKKKSNDSDSHRLVPYSSVASFTDKAVGPAWVSHSQPKNDFTVSEF